MRVDQIGDVQALVFAGGLIVVIWIVYRLVPEPGERRPAAAEKFMPEEITAYDAALPKYAFAGLAALVIGGLHAAVKSYPPVYAWLAGAGHGGHMVRDLANTHLVIVVGGTVIATGLTWYALPRIARRPLFSTKLATLSFWCTVLGAGGFYLANTVLGVIFGMMAYHGIGYEVAKESFGAARTVPIALSSTIMGIGYWTFVLNVALTIVAARRVAGPNPSAHLLKFFAVGALGLFIGTVQGVVQVLPDNERWLHTAAPAGQYIDPIAHAHVNLITGTLTLVAGLAFAWGAWYRSRAPEAPQASGRPTRASGRRRTEQIVFWTLVPGSLLFYLAFMGLGFVEGHLIVDRGLTFEQAVGVLGPYHVIPLAASGTLTLAGVWLLLGTLILRFWRGRERSMPGAILVVAGAAMLFIGTTQGLLQLLPPAKGWMVSAGDAGDAVANAHAQLNMLGGVMLALLGLMLAKATPFLPDVRVETSLTRSVAAAAVGGVLVYWSAAVANAIAVGEGIRAGLTDRAALIEAGPLGAIGMSVGALIYTGAFAAVGLRAWPIARARTADGLRALSDRIRAIDGPAPSWRWRQPAAPFLAAEVVGGAVGFIGFGWALAGRPVVGIPLVLASPGIAWALIPVLSSPYGDGPLVGLGMVAALTAYLVVTTLLSTSVLAAVLHRRRARRVQGTMAGAVDGG